MTPTTAATTRSRRDLCPGVLRPWPADDGALVRLRLVGGRLEPTVLQQLSDLAQDWGDGDVHLTRRANLQLRGLPADDGALPEELVAAFEAAGVLPSRSHELVRNIMVSPQSGLGGGRADLRGVGDELDRLLLGDPVLAQLPGRFLFVLDDGRGDLVDRDLDLGLVALDATSAQVRVGSHGWGPVLGLHEAPRHLARLARDFLALRGPGPQAPWHVDELPPALTAGEPRDPRTPAHTDPPPYGEVAGGTHVAVPDGVLTPARAAALAARSGPLVITPWHGVLVPA